MKRFGVLIAGVPLLLGMSEPVSIPPEVRNMSVTVEDTEGTVHRLRGLNCGEGASLTLKKGALDYSVSLSQIKEIRVLGVRGGEATLSVLFKDGKKEKFSVTSSLKCTSESEVGTVDFYIGEVRRISLGEVKE